MTHPLAKKGGPLSPYTGPKAKLAVADFDIQDTRVTPAQALSLHEALVKALLKKERFALTEHHPDLRINVAVSKFEPEASGGRSGVGGGGGKASGQWGGLLGQSMNKAQIYLDMRIVDVSTSKVVAAERVQGQASEGLEVAIRNCINEAVRYILQVIPKNYYQY